jgi:transposase
MKVLLTERNARIKMKRQLLGQQSDYKLMNTIGLEKQLAKMNQGLIKSIQEQIQKLEAEIEKIVQADETIKEQARQIRSVPGVGPVTCWTMIAKTAGFSMITEPRKMACYCGIVPFDHQSGTSIKRQPRVSTYADKSMKSTLHLAAMSAIRFDNKFRDYYLRKVAEGKNKNVRSQCSKKQNRPHHFCPNKKPSNLSRSLGFIIEIRMTHRRYISVITNSTRRFFFRSSSPPLVIARVPP